MRRSYHSSSLDSDISFFWFIVLAVVVSIVYMAGAGALVSESKARNAAEDLGYTDVTVVDKAVFAVQWRGCSKSDNARFTVRGTSPRGDVRTIYVCAGVLKGGTVRSK